MSSWWNVKLMKCQVGEMFTVWNAKLTQKQFDEKQVDEKPTWLKANLITHQVDKTASCLNRQLT